MCNDGLFFSRKEALMKLYWLLLFALAPAAFGYVSNLLILTPVGMLIFWLQPFLMAAFCLWFGRRCALRGNHFLSTLALTQWCNLLSIPLYIWQFHFCAEEARNLFLCLLAQLPATPLLMPAMRITSLFVDNYWELSVTTIVSVLLLGILFSAGFLWGQRTQQAAAISTE